jgi:hypothetical protein
MIRSVVLGASLAVAATAAPASTLFLDMDTDASGALLSTGSWLSPLGTMTFVGEFRDTADADMIAAGSMGNVLDVDDTGSAILGFDFDVISVSFVYGGNEGVFDVVARDGGGVVVDSFFQAWTGDGESAGPVTLMGIGIRSLFWQDPGNRFAAIDNITITVDMAPVPLPATLPLLASGLFAFGLVRRRRRMANAGRV